MISEKANELVAAYGEACKAFAWFRPHSLRDMVRAENALVGFIAFLASRDAALRKAMELVQNAVNSGEHPDYILGQVQVYAIMPELQGEVKEGEQ